MEAQRFFIGQKVNQDLYRNDEWIFQSPFSMINVPLFASWLAILLNGAASLKKAKRNMHRTETEVQSLFFWIPFSSMRLFSFQDTLRLTDYHYNNSCFVVWHLLTLAQTKWPWSFRNLFSFFHLIFVGFLGLFCTFQSRFQLRFEMQETGHLLVLIAWMRFSCTRFISMLHANSLLMWPKWFFQP